MHTIDSEELVPGRRERKKLATRASLHAAAMDLAEERGLAHVTVEAITERADVAVRTFFNYFASKEEAILLPDPGRAERLRSAIVARPPEEPPLEVMRRVVRNGLLPETFESAQLLRRMRLTHAEPALRAVLATAFEQLQRGAAEELARRTGLDRSDDAYPDLVVAVAFTACKSSLMRWCESGGSGDLDAVIDDAFDALSNGLAPPPPRHREISRS